MNRKQNARFALAASIGYLVARANWLMKTHFQDRLRQCGLEATPEQWAVLQAISEHPDSPQTEIARQSLKDKTNVTRILDLLEKRGWVARHKRSGDRRTSLVALTAAGRTLLDRLVPIARQANAWYLSRLGPRRATGFCATLAALCDEIETGRTP